MNTYSYVGCKRNTTYANRGRLFSHSMPKAGKWHALNGSLPKLRSLCGEIVYAQYYESSADPGEPAYTVKRATNVHPVNGRSVTCARCLAKIKFNDHPASDR